MMDYHFKSLAGVMSAFLIVGAVAEAGIRSPAKIELHTEVETVNKYPQPSFGATIVAGTTASSDVFVLNQYVPCWRYA